jgi:hypothetical protein
MTSVSFLPHILQLLAHFRTAGSNGDASLSHLRERADLNVAVDAQLSWRLPESSVRLLGGSQERFQAKWGTGSRKENASKQSKSVFKRSGRCFA